MNTITRSRDLPSRGYHITCRAISSTSTRTLIVIDRITPFALRKVLHIAGISPYQSSKLLQPLGDIDNDFRLRKYTPSLYADKHFHIETSGKTILDIIFAARSIYLFIFSKKIASEILKRVSYKYEQ